MFHQSHEIKRNSRTDFVLFRMVRGSFSDDLKRESMVVLTAVTFDLASYFSAREFA